MKLLALLDKSASDQLVYSPARHRHHSAAGRVPQRCGRRSSRGSISRSAILLKHHVQDAYRFLMRHYRGRRSDLHLRIPSGRVHGARARGHAPQSRPARARATKSWCRLRGRCYAVHKNFDDARGFRRTFGRKVSVDLIGVWDTVSSARYAGRTRHFDYTFDNPSVKKVRHAMALDERRAYFRQNLWEELARDGQDVLQVWFPEFTAMSAAVIWRSKPACRRSRSGGWWMRSAPSSRSTQRPSRRRFRQAIRMGSLHRTPPQNSTNRCVGGGVSSSLVPKRVAERQADGSFRKKWILPRGRSRWIAPTANIHPSVRERMKLVSRVQPEELAARKTSGAPSRRALLHQ